MGARTLSSVRVKPRPARTRRLYLMVGQRTMGRSLSTGRGATLAALATRALRRRCLRPGCANNQHRICEEVEVTAHAPLPILSEVWELSAGKNVS